MFWFFLWLTFNTTASAQPPETKVDATQEVTSEKSWWDGWMIVDKTNHRIAYLLGKDAYSATEGTIVPGVLAYKGIYKFLVPYSATFDGLMIDGDAITGVTQMNGGECLMSMQAEQMLDTHGQPRSVQFGGLTGQLYRVGYDDGKSALMIGRCK